MSRFQSVNLPSLSDSASMREVENESRKMGLDLLQKINTVADSAYPVGATYTQYPGTSAPASLFGGSWQDITATSLPVGVYDSGSNSFGSWIRYTDGTMMQWGSWNQTSTTSVSNNAGTTSGLTYYASIARTFPVQWASAPYTFATPQSNAGWTADLELVTTNGYNMVTTTGGSVSGNITANWQAIGKWSSSPVYPVTLWKRVGGSLSSATSTTINSGIYDSGTNANGSWIRFTDGTMMCWQTASVTPTLSRISQDFGSTSGTVFYIDGEWTYPLQFVSAPSYQISSANGSGAVIGWGTSTTLSQSVKFTVKNMSSAACPYSLFASGKWK